MADEPNKIFIDEETGLGFRDGSYNDEVEEANYDKYVNTVAHGIIGLSRNPTFRNLVYQKALEQFDGDDNVLLRTLSSQLVQSGTNMTQAFQNSINIYNGHLIDASNPLLTRFHQLGTFTDATNISKSILGFDYFDEVGFVQIYLPLIENTDLTKNPIIALNLEEGADIIGFSPQTDGSYTVIKVDEAIATNYPVWVISVNESFYSESELQDFLNGAPDNGPENIGPCAGNKGVRLNKFFIQDKNEEGLFSGKSDVSIVGAQEYNCGFQAFQVIPFRKVASNELCKWLSPDADGNTFVSLANCSGSFSLASGESIGFIFYERDRRKRFEKIYKHPSCINVQGLKWRSKEDEYGAVTASQLITFFNISNSTSYVHQYYIDWRPNVVPGSTTCTLGDPEGAVDIFGATFP